ncbi:MAG: tetratricopeptide repeat protein [Deltaproteobacteria bacterium]|nr:tetratricopeptide repeat protein [Deltaproteobacteria bacterium]
MRERIVEYLFERYQQLLSTTDYDSVVELQEQIIELYSPEEISRGEIPPELESISRYLLEHGSPRGDEARVLSAYLVITLLHPENSEAARNYEKLEAWGREARSALSDPLERYEGLIEIWERHARLTPTAAVLNKLANLYTERVAASIKYLQSVKRLVFLSGRIRYEIQQTLFDVAAIYLRHGDIASALTRVEATGIGASGTESEVLLDELRGARQSGVSGAGALSRLAEQFKLKGRIDVAQALCRQGLRRYPTHPIFPQCLAKIAASDSDYLGAMAWYSLAIQMVPEERALYDETLKVLNALMAQGLFDTDPTKNRKLAKRATEVLEERTRRWPDMVSPVSPDKLHLVIALAEMNAGNTEEAEKRLRQSLDEKETIDAIMQLGLLLERTGREEQAAEYYRRALALTDEKSLSDIIKRAEIFEKLGDALRLTGQSEQARESYQTALRYWEASTSALQGSQFGSAQIRQGVLLGRLGRSAEATASFELAMKYAPENRETYASILSYSLVSSPDSRFAHMVYRRALRQLSLNPEWKVYFALWLRAIAGTTGARIEPEIDSILEELAKGNEWWAKLAGFGLGKISYSQLLAQASDLGERTEAYFYEAIRLLVRGEAQKALRFLHLVRDTGMVNFYEFAIAQELLQSIGKEQHK